MRKKEEKFNVFFTQDFSLVDRPEPGQIIITQSKSKWNDFGYRIHYEFKACFKNDILIQEGHMLLGFLPPKGYAEEDIYEFEKNKGELNEIFNRYVDESTHLVESKKLPPFFTLQTEIESYRSLVIQLGVENTNFLLNSLNDLVFHKEKKESSDWIEVALTSRVFNISFLRNSEPFFAFHNADSILQGLKYEDLSKISKSLDLNFKLDNFQNEHVIKFRFNNESIVPKRINILIGKNALGKSQALNHFTRAVLRYKEDEKKLIDPERDEFRPMINRLLAIATPGETSNTYPNEYTNTQKTYYRRLILTRGKSRKKTNNIGDSLVQLVRSVESIGNLSRWEIFCKSLSKIISLEEVAIELTEGNPLSKDYVTLSDLDRLGSEQTALEIWMYIEKNKDPKMLINEKLYPLSSGQITFFKFGLLACLYIENGSFVLMDEPETHLHPNMIANFVELLDEILENTGSQAIIATHSPYFVREVGREQVHVFKRENENVISIVSPRLKTFGASIDSISQFVFDEDNENRLNDKVYEKIKGRTFDSVDKDLGKEMSLAALMEIREKMKEEQ
jgi:AAA domain, putative AbiEii toxin, Type IV TA system